MAWAFLCGFVSSKALLFMACVSLACTIPYMAAAITQPKLGNTAAGVTWLYFGAFFALGSALNYGTSLFASIYQLKAIKTALDGSFSMARKGGKDPRRTWMIGGFDGGADDAACRRLACNHYFEPTPDRVIQPFSHNKRELA